MSSTRYAPAGAPLRQNKFSSSPALRADGLKPALVAARCSVLDDPEARELIWYLQARSHQPGGMAAVADELRTDFEERIIPTSIASLRNKPAKQLDAATVEKLKHEMWGRDAIYVRGNTSRTGAHARLWFNEGASFIADEFFHWARQCAALDLADLLNDLCLNPSLSFSDPWYFQDLRGAIQASAEKWANAHAPGIAKTSVGKSLIEAIEYAGKTGSVVLFSGPNSSGKSFQARAYCEQQPGLARYWQVASGNNRRTFFKGGVDALGGPAGNAYKALELQQRIEDIVVQSGLVLVFDDAIQLLPDREREATPDRIDWIVTAVAERGVPAVILADPSFDVRLLAIQERSRWSMRGFNERVFRWPVPPLGKAGIQSVATAMFPTAASSDVAAMVHATLTAGAGSLRFLEHIRRSVAVVAGKDPITADHIRTALKGYVIPHANALTTAMENAKRKAGRKFTRTPAAPVSPAIGGGLAETTRTPREDMAPALESTREIAPKAHGRAVAPEGILTVPG